MTHSIFWRGLDRRGHEACRLFRLDNEWRLEGMAVLDGDGRPGGLAYSIACDARWHTLRATVSGWLGDENVEIDVAVDGVHQWQLNGVEQSGVNGCVDFDLNFSPSTNLLPIRRLNLEIGQSAEVRAAWLRFPSFQLEPLSQIYTRRDEFTYHYSSNGGAFESTLKVNEVGFVIDYPGLWVAEA